MALYRTESGGGSRGRDLLCVAALFVLSAVFFYPFWAKGKVFLPADFLYNQAPWSLTDPGFPEARNPEPSDAVQQHYPWRVFYKESVGRGIVPLWNPRQFCGQPFAANDQSAVFYPLNAVVYPLFDAATAYTLLAWLHLFMGGAFMFLLLRYERAGRAGALLGAVVFMFNGCHTVWMAHAAKQAAMAWTPLAILLAGIALRRRNMGAAALCAAVVAAQLTAGFLQFESYSLFAVAAYTIYFIIFRAEGAGARVAGLRVAAVVFAFGIAAAAVHVWPVMELAGLSERPVVVPHNGWFPGIPLKNAVNFVSPDYFGSPLDAKHGAGLNYTETNFYVGVPALLLAAAAFFALRRRRSGMLPDGDGSGLKVAAGLTPGGCGAAGGGGSSAGFYLLLWCFALAAMFGTPLYGIYYYLVPGARSLVVGRIGYLFTFATAALAGMGLCFILKSLEEKNKNVLKNAVAAAAVALTAGAMLPWSMRFNTFSGKELVFARTTLTDYLKERAGDGRFITGDSDWLLFPDAATALGIDDVRGYDSLYPARSRRLMGEIQRHWGRTGARRAATVSDAPSVYFAAPFGWMNVRYVISANPAEFAGRRVVDAGGVFAVENPRALPRAFFSSGWIKLSDDNETLRVVTSPAFRPERETALDKEPPIEIHRAADGRAAPASGGYGVVSSGPGELDLHYMAEANSLLFVSETYYPGWRAEVDGEPVEVMRANYAFMAVPVKKGGGRLRLWFSPASARGGLAVSLAAIAMLCALVIAGCGLRAAGPGAEISSRPL